MKLTTPCLCLLALAATGGVLNAGLLTTNVARSGVFVESSPAYSTAFPVTGVIDGNVNEGTNATPVSYWITPNNVPKNAFFTLDLRGSYAIDSVVLYNTHNRQSYDRGTGPFVLYGAGAIEPRPPFSGGVDRYYSFDGDLNDHSTNGINALFLDVNSNAIPATLAADVPAAVAGDSQSLTFTGAGEFLEFVDPLLPRQPTAYSISVWVKLPVVQKCSLIFRATPVGEGAGYAHQLRVNAGLNFEAYTFDTAARTVSGTTVIQPDTWYHVVATAQNNSFQHLYVNGVEEGTPVAVGTLWAGGDRWRAGRAGGGFAALAGQLDELGIWLSAPLTPAMVTRLANGERPATVASTPLASTGYQLVNPQVVVSGTLTQVATGQPALAPQTFPVSPPVTARYVQFCTLGASYANNYVGLNEIQVMSQVDSAPPPLRADNALFLKWANRGVQEVLQTSPNLTAPAWSTPAGSPAMLDTNWWVYLVATNSAGFYRLIGP